MSAASTGFAIRHAPPLRWVTGAALVLALFGLSVPDAARGQAGIPYLAEPEPPKKAKGKAKEASAEPVEEAPAAAPVPAPPAALPLAAEPLETTGKPFAFFADLWRQRRAALERGDGAAAKQLLDRLLEAKSDAGWPDVFVLGEALALESSQARHASETRAALELASAAVVLAPHLPAVHLELAQARWAASAGALPTLGSIWRAAQLSLSEPPLLRLRMGNLALALTLAIVLTTVWFALTALLRHGGTFVHDLKHLLPPGTTSLQATLLGIGVLCVPIFLRVGLGWTLLCWVGLMSLYFGRNDRLAAAALLGLLALAAGLLPQITSHLAYSRSRSQDVYLAVRDAGAEAAEARIKARPVPLPEELYALGLRARWSGRLSEAQDWLSRAAKGGAEDHLLVTLGNIQYLAGDTDAAIKSYETVLQRDADNVVALFNLSRAYYAKTDHQRAGEAHRRAMALEYDRVDQMNRDAKRVGRTYVVEGEVPRPLLAVSLEYGRQHTQAVAQLWSPFGGKSSRLVFAGAAAAVAALAWLAMFLAQLLRPSASCPRCGDPACRRCNPEMPNAQQCGQCFHAFVERTGVDPQTRIHKEISALRHRARRTRIQQVLSFLCAGAGQMARGAAPLGLGLMLVFLAALAVFLAAIGVLPELAPTSSGLGWLSSSLSFALGLTVYILGLVDGLREHR